MCGSEIGKIHIGLLPGGGYGNGALKLNARIIHLATALSMLQKVAFRRI